jgi:D-alanyl-D-alanine dipeptidase
LVLIYCDNSSRVIRGSVVFLHFVLWANDINDTKTKKEFYPNVDKENLFRDGYIAGRSSHSRGSTVDLSIVPVPTPLQPVYVAGQTLAECTRPAGERFADNSIDMGTGFDCFDELSHPENPRLGQTQRITRIV